MDFYSIGRAFSLRAFTTLTAVSLARFRTPASLRFISFAMALTFFPIAARSRRRTSSSGVHGRPRIILWVISAPSAGQIPIYDMFRELARAVMAMTNLFNFAAMR